jgi:CO/xanthine dehydrogenase FAD-binding subunit
VKPSRFDYHAPATVEEAIALLTRYGGEAKLLAGGQSLMPLMNFRLARPAALIDLNAIESLAYIREADGQIRFGAMTRQRTIEFSPVVRRRLPLLAEATALVGHLPIRTRGTIGGSIAHADPSAEYPTALTALGDRWSSAVRESVRWRASCSDHLTTTLAADGSRRGRLPAMPNGPAAFES